MKFTKALLRHRLASTSATKTQGNKEQEEAEKVHLGTNDQSRQGYIDHTGGNSISMFNKLERVSIHGGNFVQNNLPTSNRSGFNHLQNRVATSAFHNSAQRTDPPRCHPNTRALIQKEIYDWILLDSDTRQAWIMWLHGAAGAGKSAIMQSIAELCEKEEFALASFFFFRTDPTRNSMSRLISTLVYQLIQSIPETQDEIFAVIESNPLIFDQSLESQLQKLVIQPLLRLQGDLQRILVVLIDGLDECNDKAHQSDLIKLLGNASRPRTIPVIFLIASRREPQIESAFVHNKAYDRNLLLTIPLDNSDIEQTSQDIRRFLTDKFNDIRATHLRRSLLPKDWPPVLSVEDIVTKSSGQFIYASVVINYISSPRANPAHQLDIVSGIRLRDPASQNPFAHLDALYEYIFSQVEALPKVFDILAYVLIASDYYIASMEHLFLLAPGELEIYLADLISVIECDPRTNWGPKMRFLHASLPDFLTDESRSGKYHIDFDEYTTKLLCQFLERPPPTLDSHFSVSELGIGSYQESWRLYGIKELLMRANTSERLHHALINFNFVFDNIKIGSDLTKTWIDILQYLNTMNFDGQGQVYRHFLGIFTMGYTQYWPLLAYDIQDQVKMGCPDFLAGDT